MIMDQYSFLLNEVCVLLQRIVLGFSYMGISSQTKKSHYSIIFPQPWAENSTTLQNIALGVDLLSIRPIHVIKL